MSVAKAAPSQALDPRTARQVLALFKRTLEGNQLRISGSLASRADRVLALGYRPRFLVELFGTRYFLCQARENEDIRFLPAFVQWRDAPGRLFGRLFYKDVSLTWRAASHFSRLNGENWIGKGEVRHQVRGDLDIFESNEATTDLPLEIQTALENAVRSSTRIPYDADAVNRFLRQAPSARLAPYADFTKPREQARLQRDLLVNGGKPIAWFAQPSKPESLRFARGFEPDFSRGVMEESILSSSLYGGAVARLRIVSKNRRAQFAFLRSPSHAWVASVQSTADALTSFGVRAVDAVVDEDFLLPGFEYHFYEDGDLHSQIPKGFAGQPSPQDPHRADAAPWLSRVPVLKRFARAYDAGRLQPASG